ncbi:MAG: invasion associated locus B family protein [Limimaricola sp.]|uniref:invasion associated locus B family protein n=1 Tax=Limimaricola sp. TaxID=2211665 RepID=UPI001DBE3FFC|nr:invasion associated locus B family protein [Limimaricola sp.]MBI1418218.1 invasion associated locus B family protein [Limimaricola sp.]
MLNPIKTLALLAICAAAPAFAQDQTSSGAPAAPDLNLGTTVNSDGTTEPQVGQTYIKETFTDWSSRCLKTADGKDPCQLYQLLKDSNGNSVAEISIFPLASGAPAAAGSTIVAPLETLLTKNLTLVVGTDQAKQYPFTFCNRAGCIARIGFTADEVDQFRKGATATLTLTPVATPNQPVSVEISLKGFTAGYASLPAPAPAAAPAASGN